MCNGVCKNRTGRLTKWLTSVVVSFLIFQACVIGEKPKLRLSGHNSALSQDTAINLGQLLGANNGFQQSELSIHPRHLEETATHDEDVHMAGQLVLAGFILVGVGLAGVLAPYALKFCANAPQRIAIGISLAFASGSLLGLAIFHLVPESVEALERKQAGIVVNGNFYNVAYIALFAGFCAILFLERVASPPAETKAAMALRHHPRLSVTLSEQGREVAEIRAVSIDIDLQRQREASTVVPHHLGDHIHPDGTCTFHAHPAKQAEGISISHEIGAERLHDRGIDAQIGWTWGPIAAVIALAFHSVFEGIILGMSHDVTSMWLAVLSIIGHHWSAGFALSMGFLAHSFHKTVPIVFLGIFVISHPIGILIGSLVSGTNPVAEGTINGLCAGTVLFIGAELTFTIFSESHGPHDCVTYDDNSQCHVDESGHHHFEVTTSHPQHEIHVHARILKNAIADQILKFAVFLLGAGLVLGLSVLEVATGGHGEHASEH